jgi:CRISPR-associated endonuclease/helicase Cas3
VLDSFANRIGDNTWQTVITAEGLQAVKKLLRKTASKSTAVSCFWIRSRSRSEFIWCVGNKDKFNAEGVVPVNTTQKTIMNTQWENDWHYLPLIKALAAIAALLHDWGKATALFQGKLKKNSRFGDPIRHEWISCLLLNALVQGNGNSSDNGWLTCLIEGVLDENKLKEVVTQQASKPLHNLPPAAKLIAWLIVSHHRLPYIEDDWRDERSPNIATMLARITQSWGYENRQDEQEFNRRLSGCFEFPNGLLSQSSKWQKELKKWAQRLQACQIDIERSMADGSYRLLLHHARLCLMLGDHFYSSQNAAPKWPDRTGLFANTDRATGNFKQKLDEHLVGVAKNALRTAHLLPAFEEQPPVAVDISSLKKPSPKAFYWQDKAVSKINIWKKEKVASQQAVFAVNMASTGCGKTFANAKVMRALSDDGESLRYVLALGLRTLTLQTGDEYRERIGLDDSELAVLIGSQAVTELHREAKLEQGKTENGQTGSESEQPLLDEYIDYDCDIPEEGLAMVLTKEKDRKFLYAPVLACTIDHMMAATETRRGGRYILPSLRLMSSDLVIDEIDDFTGSDLIAIGRLVHLAGMLGRKVMISSATIPPDLAEGYFNAYKKGWQLYSKTRDAKDDITCIWVDEFKTELQVVHSAKSEEAIATYQAHHTAFIDKRVNNLTKQPAKRKAEIIECKESMEEYGFDEETKQKQYFNRIQEASIKLHHLHHSIDKKTGIAVSFGVVRMANISPCIALARHLLQAECPDGVEVRAMAYHSQQLLLLRHEQEKHLDSILKRKEKNGEQPVAFSNTIIRGHLDSSTSKHLLFILVATPVEEVGRDHDFDWAVIEPSSYRSIIQLAGRVKRHREGEVKQPNIALMQYNWKVFKDGDESGKKQFNRPGYEEKVTLDTHNLRDLIDEQEVATRLDAIPRIKKNSTLNYRQSLADLEHVVTESELTSYHRVGPDTLQGFLAEAWFLSALPQILNPFRKSEQTTKLFLCFDEENETCCFVEKDEKGYPTTDRENILNITRAELSEIEQRNLWLSRDYLNLLAQYSEKNEMSKRRVSLRYGELSLVIREGYEYEYSDQFGLAVVK